MNKVSIIINGVRYDLTECQSGFYKVCEECDLEDFCESISHITTLCQAFDISEDDIHFKKSDKKFEP